MLAVALDLRHPLLLPSDLQDSELLARGERFTRDHHEFHEFEYRGKQGPDGLLRDDSNRAQHPRHLHDQEDQVLARLPAHLRLDHLHEHYVHRQVLLGPTESADPDSVPLHPGFLVWRETELFLPRLAHLHPLIDLVFEYPAIRNSESGRGVEEQ